jgi:hypothetical protein
MEANNRSNMINLSRSEDKKALVGTITVYIMLFLLLLVMSMFNACSEVEAEEMSSGGVAVSLGNPNDGGPDNSAAEEETETATEEDYTPENQLTSDVAEAPPVVKNEPKTKAKETNKPIKEKPKDPKPTPKPPKINIGKNKGKDINGSGKGGDSNSGGYKGKPDGTGTSPDGEGKGTLGSGTGDGPSLGPGVSGGIGGFSAKIALPQGGVQENGVVRLKVCVNSQGAVKEVKHEPKVGDYRTTSNRDLIARAKYSVNKSTFRNISGSDGGCGYITYTFKLQ